MATKTKKKDLFQEDVEKKLDSMDLQTLFEKHQKVAEIMKHPLWTMPPQSVEDSYRFGWMRGIAFMTDTMLDGRWYEWLRINNVGEMKDPAEMPKSKINNGFNASTNEGKMLEKCMQHVYNAGYNITEFIEWIGYALGIAWFTKPNIPEHLWEKLYREFNLDMLQMKPADYLSEFVALHGKRGHLDYYPTPVPITVFINSILNHDSNKSRIHSQFEPCIGGAAMLLPSHSLNLVGADLSPTMVKVASIQAFLYMPSMLYVPKPIIGLHVDRDTLTINKYFEFNTDTRIYWGNSLLGEYTAPKNIFEENSEQVDVYCHPVDLSKREILQYEEEMMEPWDSLSYEMKVKIVKAQVREIGWDSVTTNPPFNASLGKTEKAIIRSIEDDNKVFTAEREKRLAALKQKKLPVLEYVLYDVQLKMNEIKSRKIAEGQFEFDLV